MKKMIIVLITLLLIILPFNVQAKSGCCSHHGGVAGCNNDGRQICNDGTLSPSCTCTPTIKQVYGCTDEDATNYDEKANKDDGSCTYETEVTSLDNSVQEESNYVNNEQIETVKFDDSSSSPFSTILGIGIMAGSGYYLIKKRK